MKISLNWLNDYIEIGLPAEKIADILSNLGFPCEGIEYTDGDAVMDIEITSNRGDCLGYIGVARELAAATGKELKIPDVKLPYSKKAVTEFADVEIAEAQLCHRYTARIIEGVKVGPSPQWMKKRLESAGLRSVNNVVDATNYAMLESGQPPHAFDYKKIAGGKIIVRRAKAGEQLISIDGSKCALDAAMLIIADSEKPVAIAGVMGGLETEVSDGTETVLLEDAYFDPVSVRTTSRKLTLPSESSFRFERTVDVEMMDFASGRTCQLITQLAGGKVAKGVIDIYPKKPKKDKVVILRLERLNKLLGIEVRQAEVMSILERLGFAPKQEGDKVVCSSPSWRSDVYKEADLIEEIARVYGYDKIPVEKKIQIEVVPAEPRQQLTKIIGAYLNGCGFYETVNVTFVDDSAAALFGTGQIKNYLAVKDESKKNTNLLRQSLLGSLFGVLKTNLNAKNTPCRIFEIATTFQTPESSNALPVEKTRLTLVSDGQLRGLRGVIEGLLKNINKEAEISFAPAKLRWAEVGAQVVVDKEVIGTVGIVSKEVKDKFDFKVSVVGAELDFEALAANHRQTVKIKPIPRFPAIERDLSIVVDEQIAWDNIATAIKKKAPAELEDVRFVGIYRGKGILKKQKSVTLSLCFRDEDGTLTHETVDKYESGIMQSLNKFVAATLRTI